jgi:phosphoribosylaminoimidazolecarboxamide formyltransferase/IMP cyclohydrolase
MSKPERTARSQYQTKVREDFPDVLRLGDDAFVKKLPMRYGENPGYPAAFYQEEGAEGPNMGHMEVLQEGTKGLSYINVGDMDLGQRLSRKLVQAFSNVSTGSSPRASRTAWSRS